MCAPKQGRLSTGQDHSDKDTKGKDSVRVLTVVPSPKDCACEPSLLDEEKIVMLENKSSSAKPKLALQEDSAHSMLKPPLAPIAASSVVADQGLGCEVKIPCGLNMEVDCSPRDSKLSTQSNLSNASVSSKFIVGSELIHYDIMASSSASDVGDTLTEQDASDIIIEQGLDRLTDRDFPETQLLLVTECYVSY
jgi:hypothetical protein